MNKNSKRMEFPGDLALKVLALTFCVWDLVPGLGTSVCHGCSQKKKKEKTAK